jgi:molybdopterin converting factor small subunit
MAVSMNVPYFLRQHTAGLKTVDLKAGTVGECLQELFTRYPAVEKDLFTQGILGKHYILYVNDEKIPYPAGTERVLKDGDHISIEVALLAGG